MMAVLPCVWLRIGDMVGHSKIRKMGVADIGCKLGFMGLLLYAAPGYAVSNTVQEPMSPDSDRVLRVTPPVLSQTVPPVSPIEPDGDRFLQPIPLPPPVTPAEQAPVITTPSPSPTPLPTDESVQIEVQRIEVIGSTVFDAEDFAPIVQPAEGRSLTLEALRGIADQITQLYLNEGYLTSRAVLVDQVVTAGVIQLRVIEGSLETIEVQGAERVQPDYVRSRVALGANTPLNQADLEDQLRLLRLDPLFDNVEASLRAGTGLGQSILTVRVTEANPFSGNVSVDNFSPPSVGSERLGLVLSYRNLTGWGDELTGQYYRSTTGGSSVYDLSYRIPVNPLNGTLQLRAAPTDYRITDPEFADQDISGNADEYEISFRQPLRRSPREEFALSLGITTRDGDSFFSDLQIDDSTTTVIGLGQDWVLRDASGAWALRSQFNIGTSLLNADTGIEPDGLFFSWLGQAQRVQVLSPDQLLILQADLQLTPDPLPGSQQFVIGGGQSLRGFRQNARLGDNGFRVSVENQIALGRNESGAVIFQVAPFVDAGAVWNDGDNPADTPDDSFLAGIGLGLLWEPLPDLNIRLDFALPLVEISDRGENAQDRAFYFSVNYAF